MFKSTPMYANMARMSVDDFTELLKTDANEAFIKVLAGAKGSGKGFSEMAVNLDQLGLDGARSTSVLAVLANNIDKLREKQAYSNQEFEKGTSLQKEFDIKNNTAQANLDKAKKGFDELARKLGKELTPAYASVISKSSLLLNGISIMVAFLYKYSGAIIAVTATIAAYALVVKVSSYWDSIHYGFLVAKSAVTTAYTYVVGVLTGRITLATVAQNAWNLAQKLNPIGLVIGLLVAAGAALYLYSKRLTTAEVAQRALNDINMKAQQSISAEKTEMEQLLRVAQNEVLSKAMRQAAIEKLNQLSPEYLGGLTLETINTDAAKVATDKYIDSLLKKAELEAATENLKEVKKEIGKLEAGDVDPGFAQNALGIIKHPSMTWAAVKATTKKENIDEQLPIKKIEAKVYQDKIDEIVKNQSAAITTSDEPKDPDPPIPTPETPAEKKAREEKEKADKAAAAKALRETNKVKKTELELVEAANNHIVASINKRHIEGKTSEDQYNADLLEQEFIFLQSKMDLYKVGSKEYEDAHAQFLEKQVASEKKVKDLLLEAQKELANAKIDNLKDGIAKEKAIEEQRWKDELDGLKKQLLDKENLSKDELLYNDTINKLIEEKTTAHLKTTNDLILAGELEKQMNKALIDEANAGSDEERWIAETELAQAKYDEELKTADGNAVKIAQAERNLADTTIKIKIDELNKREEIGNAVFNAANNAFGALAEIAGKESALGKAMFLAQQASAIGQIIFNTAIANSKAVAMSPATFGQPWVTINTISAAVSIASVVAQALKEFAGGGYTGDGDKYEPAGIVHKGEYVVTKEEVGSIGLQPLRSMIKMLRNTNSNTRLDLNPAVQTMNRSGGFASGGYVSSGGSATPGSSTVINSDPELKALIKELTNQVKGGIKAQINKYGTNGLSDAMDDITKFNTKVYKK